MSLDFAVAGGTRHKKEQDSDLSFQNESKSYSESESRAKSTVKATYVSVTACDTRSGPTIGDSISVLG